MRSFLPILFSFLFLFAAAQKEFDPSLMKKSSSQTRIIGTKLFMEIPQGFEYVKPFMLLKKNNSTFISVQNNPTIPYNVIKQGFGTILDRSLKDTLLREFTLGTENVFFFKATEHDTSSGILFIIGNETSSLMLMAQFRVDDANSYTLLLHAISTSFYDETFDLDPAELAHTFTDIDKTDLKFLTVKSFGAVFTRDGKGIYSELPTQTQVLIDFESFIHVADTARCRFLIKEKLDRFGYNGYQVDSNRKWEIKFGNKISSIQLTYGASYADKRLVGIMSYTISENGAVFFSAVAFEDRQKMLHLFRSLIDSIKLE